MSKRGRPMINDVATMLGMAQHIKISPNMSPTEAFRLVFRATANEQSEEAARKRCLRKFKTYRKPWIGHSTPEAQHIRQESTGTIDQSNRAHTNAYYYDRAFQSAAKQMNNHSAYDAMQLAIGAIDFGGANNALEMALAQMNNNSAYDAIQLAIGAIDFDGMSNAMDIAIKQMGTLANRF